MSIQILGYREYYDKKTQQIKLKTAFLNEKWRAKSVAQLFKNIDNYINNIPQEERYNIHYTVASCIDGPGRKLEYQTVIPFDLDGIDLNFKDKYIEIVLNALELDRDKTGITCSGNGLHFLVETKTRITYEEYFDEHKIYYKGLCAIVSQQLYDAGLCGIVDPVVFSKGKTLRLPCTTNKKTGKPDTESYIIQGNIEPVDFDIIERSKIPVVEFNEQISEEMLKRLPAPDTEGVLNGCDFIKYCKAKPNELSEPKWYALLSILGRLESGDSLAHDYSRGHSNYNINATDSKLNQALTASGPRTCDSINNLWDGCTSCTNWRKCKSPITIKSEGYIKTKDTGFYNIRLDKGIPTKGKPNYDDLMKQFALDHSFVTLAEGNITFTWTGSHWEDHALKRIDAFAETNFDPTPNNQMCNEFRGKLQRNNIRDSEWFSPEGYINFSNGLLDIDTMELSNHDQDKGYKYVLPFPYDPSADCPRFTKFLGEVTSGDRELQQVLLEFMGYSLSNIDASIGQKALVLVGKGSNGKSVFMDVLKYLAGKGNYSTLSMGNEISKLENRYQLDGKLFNISEETPTNAMMDSTIFKALVTGGEVQARKLYCDAYSMRNVAKIIMACNELPSTRDLSYGMFRRLLLAPFNAKFVESDSSYDVLIRDKLYAEASGIYNLIIQALLTFKRNKVFSTSVAIVKQVESYRRDNDDVLVWWEDNMVTCDESTFVAVADLYSSYRIDMEQSGQKPRAQVWFGRKIRDIVGDNAKFGRQRVNGTLKATVKGWKAGENDGGEF